MPHRPVVDEDVLGAQPVGHGGRELRGGEAHVAPTGHTVGLHDRSEGLAEPVGQVGVELTGDTPPHVHMS